MVQNFSTTVSDWQGVDDEPTAESENLVMSGGVQNELALGAVYDVSAKNPTAGPNNDGKFESLSALLSDANLNILIPTSVRKGGMSIRFVLTSDNKYVQFRYMSSSTAVADFTNVANWQGVDAELFAGSKNLAESGAAEKSIEVVNNKIGTQNLKLGGFNALKQITSNDTRAYLKIYNPKTTIYAATGYVFNIYGEDDGDVELTSIATSVTSYNAGSDNYQYIWILVKDANDSTRSLANDDLGAILYINGIAAEIAEIKSDLQDLEDDIDVVSDDIQDLKKQVYTYTTKEISSDFTTYGFYTIDEQNGLTFNERAESTGWRAKVIPVSEIDSVKTYIGNLQPAIIYLTGAEPIEANRIVGAEQDAVYGVFNSRLIIPSNATHIIVSAYTISGVNQVTYKSSNIKELFDEVNSLRTEVEDNIFVTNNIPVADESFNTGFYKIGTNGLEYGSSSNWRNKIFDLSTDLLNAVNVVVSAPAPTGVAPAIIYLSSSEPTESNRIVGAEQWGTEDVGHESHAYYRFNGNLIIPNGATHAIVNYALAYENSCSLSYKTPIKELVGNAEQKKVVSVDKNGNGDYTTIMSAVNHASAGDTILVYPGTYEEVVNTGGKEVHIVGVCRETCILTNGYGTYLEQPLNMNIGSIENMTIIADTYDSTIIDPTTEQKLTSYALHIERENSTPYKMVIRNCTLVSKWNAAIGMGLRYNQTVIIEDCELKSECTLCWSNGQQRFVSMGALFMHNDAIDTTHTNESGHLVLKNCKLSGVNYALRIHGISGKAYAAVEYINNNLVTQNNGVTNIVEYWEDDPNNPRFVKAINSYGNNIAELNA